MKRNLENAVALSDEQIEALKAAALAATPQNIDGAQEIDRYDDGSHYECPACGGEGSVPRESEFCNYDGEALGVQFYGIGNAVGTAEAYFRAANPATVLALIARLERAEAATPIEQAVGVRERFVLDDVCNERLRQDKQWGGDAHDDQHSVLEWLGFIDHQTDKAISETAGLQTEGDMAADVRARLVKIAALAVAGMASIDRRFFDAPYNGDQES